MNAAIDHKLKFRVGM